MNEPTLVCKSIVACEKSSIDPQSKLLSLTNIVNRLFVTLTAEEQSQIGNVTKQIKIPLEVIIFWERKGGEGDIQKQFKLHFVDPKGKILFDQMSSEVKMGPKTQKFYSLLKLGGLPCASSGMHTFEVHQSNGTAYEKVCEESFEIFMVDEKGNPVII